MRIPSMLSLLPLVVFGLTACGGSEGGDGNQSTEPKTQTFTIEGNDQMAYDVKTLEAKVGPVEITLKNVGEQPVETMGHNLIVLKKGQTAMKAGAKFTATATPENDYMPEGLAAVSLAHTKTLGPGESETLKFSFPEAGEYQFFCSFPGHFSTMRGVIVVSE